MSDAVWRDVHRSRVWRAQACRIVEESAETIALWIPAGSLAKVPDGGLRIPGETGSSATRSKRDAICVARAGRRTFGLPLLAGRRQLDHWYVNFEQPLRRTPLGFDTFDEKLDSDRTVRRQVSLEGRGRARAGRRGRAARCGRGSRGGRARAPRVAVPDRLGGVATRPRLADPAAARRLGPGLRRRGPLAAFVGLGLLWGGWAALVPAVQEAVGASKGTLGLALLFVAVGSLPGDAPHRP